MKNVNVEKKETRTETENTYISFFGVAIDDETAKKAFDYENENGVSSEVSDDFVFSRPFGFAYADSGIVVFSTDGVSLFIAKPIGNADSWRIVNIDEKTFNEALTAEPPTYSREIIETVLETLLNLVDFYDKEAREAAIEGDTEKLNRVRKVATIALLEVSAIKKDSESEEALEIIERVLDVI